MILNYFVFDGQRDCEAEEGAIAKLYLYLIYTDGWNENKGVIISNPLWSAKIHSEIIYELRTKLNERFVISNPYKFEVIKYTQYEDLIFSLISTHRYL